MCAGSSRLFAAAFRGFGIDGRPCPDGDDRTKELAAKHTCGDECYPQMVTLGAILKVAEEPGFDPSRTAVFFPTASGPCRFGQYGLVIEDILKKLDLGDVLVVKPSFDDGYRSTLGEKSGEFRRIAWWAIVCGDVMRALLYKTRPYEVNKGDADEAYDLGLAELEETLAGPAESNVEKFTALASTLAEARDRFRRVKVNRNKKTLLIGVVGEIFCRLNDFSNDEIVRKIEEYGGEAWMADIAEWVTYASQWEIEELKKHGKRWSVEMATAWLTKRIQLSEEHKLRSVAAEDLAGYEEPNSVTDVLERARPYLPPEAGLGEMVLNLGKSSYLYDKGVDGVVDVSPFSCMNGIVSEALYPTLAKDHDDLPIRTFYFDGTQVDLDNDVGIFMELASTYNRRKKRKRTPPAFINY